MPRDWRRHVAVHSRLYEQTKNHETTDHNSFNRPPTQHTQDGRHLAGLTLMRGVPLVATSPVSYVDELSSGQQILELGKGGPIGAADDESPNADQNRHQQQQQQQYTIQSVQGSASPQQADIHAYQPPWKNLIDYAHQHPSMGAPNQQQQPQPTGPANATSANTTAANQSQQPDRLNTTSPRYQQLIGQVSFIQIQSDLDLFCSIRGVFFFLSFFLSMSRSRPLTFSLAQISLNQSKFGAASAGPQAKLFAGNVARPIKHPKGQIVLFVCLPKLWWEESDNSHWLL